MARGTTLLKLLDKLRYEARLSGNPAHNAQVRDTHVNMLQRTQERLWQDFTWPHLRKEWQVKLQLGQRVYDTPEDLDIDRVEKIEIFRDGGWYELAFGIGGAEYSTWNSDLGEQSWPPQRWRIVPDEQLEIWPVPDQNADDTTREGYLKFTGTRRLRQLVDDGDRADLDDNMLALYCAAEILAASGAKDAKFKLDQANTLYAKQRGGLSPRRTVRMFGIGEPQLPRRPIITTYRPPGS